MRARAVVCCKCEVWGFLIGLASAGEAGEWSMLSEAALRYSLPLVLPTTDNVLLIGNLFVTAVVKMRLLK